jgi:hypothetical protein
MSENIKEQGVLHFSLGEEFGIRLMEIAQEHLIYGYNPVKAVATITDGLIGCPYDFALKILKGDIVLFVEGDGLIATERTSENDKIFPKLDIQNWITRRHNDIVEHGEVLKSELKTFQSKIHRDNYKFEMNFDYDSIFKFIAGNDNIILDELRDNSDIKQIELLISVTKKYIDHSLQIKSAMEWIVNTWGDEDEEYSNIIDECSDSLMNVMNLLKDTLSLDFDFGLIEDDELASFVENTIEIDNIISKGIEPVDIMDNYSAGWLSPEGVFYGLNGDIANMLHQQIADALVEINIIPENYKENAVNPDSWLAKNGWVKIHGNNIQFEGCLNYRLQSKNINLSNKQINIVKCYINYCHSGIMRLGWKLIPVSAARFEMMAEEDIIALNKEYFEY